MGEYGVDGLGQCSVPREDFLFQIRKRLLELLQEKKIDYPQETEEMIFPSGENCPFAGKDYQTTLCTTQVNLLLNNLRLALGSTKKTKRIL